MDGAKKWILLCFVLIMALWMLAVLVGCGATAKAVPADDMLHTVTYLGSVTVKGACCPTHIYRFVDTDAGVMCWLSSDYDSGGISCIPLAKVMTD